MHISDRPTDREQHEAAAQRCAADEDCSNAKRTERNHRKGPEQADAADHGPERIASQTVEKQCKHAACGHDEISHSAGLQPAEDSKSNQLWRVYDRNTRVDPKNLIENQHVGQWSEQDDAQLRRYDAWERWHIEAARQEVTGESEAPKRNQCRDL